MKDISVFKIYKKVINWQTEVEEDCDLVDLGAVIEETDAMDIVSILEEENKQIDVSYFYEKVNFNLFKDKKEFFQVNYRIDRSFE